MESYSHTQRATLLLAIFVGTAIFLVAILATGFTIVHNAQIPAPVRWSIPLFVLATQLVTALLFFALTITVGDGKLTWRFGWGPIKKSVPLSEIIKAEPMRTTFMMGWGIHYTRSGWLYNVSGYDAVRITLRTGKQFVLGTDDPSGLVHALGVPRE